MKDITGFLKQVAWGALYFALIAAFGVILVMSLLNEMGFRWVIEV